MPNHPHFGALIRDAREARGLRQRDVGDLLTGRPDGGQIHKYETGRGSAPKVDRAIELIVALGIDPIAGAVSYLASYASQEKREAFIAALSRTPSGGAAPGSDSATPQGQAGLGQAADAAEGLRPPGEPPDEPPQQSDEEEDDTDARSA